MSKDLKELSNRIERLENAFVTLAAWIAQSANAPISMYEFREITNLLKEETNTEKETP